MITVAQEYVLKTPAIGGLNKQPDGRVTVSFVDGRVMSVNSYGGVETRPAGTAGPQELATVVGENLVFSVSGDNGSWAYWFPFTEKDLTF